MLSGQQKPRDEPLGLEPHRALAAQVVGDRAIDQRRAETGAVRPGDRRAAASAAGTVTAMTRLRPSVDFSTTCMVGILTLWGAWAREAAGANG